MLSNFTTSQQKHPPGKLKKHIYTAHHISFCVCTAAYRVKTSNDFYGTHSTASNMSSPQQVKLSSNVNSST